MHGMITTLLLLSGATLSVASSGWDLTSSADTAVKIINSGSGKGLTVTSPDIAVQATGDYVGVEGNSTQSGGVGVSGNAADWFSVGVAGTSDFVGVRATSNYGVGMEAFGGATGVSAYGPIGVYAQGSGAYSYGIYATASGTGAYAGMFDGNVYVNGACNPCSPSDEKFKTDIRDLSGAVKTIMALKPKTYKMKTKEYAGVINLAEGNQYGFLAQELEAVLPDIVHEAKIPVQLSLEETKNHVKKPPVDFKGISYTDLIPILVRAIQEQQAEIEALKKRR